MNVTTKTCCIFLMLVNVLLIGLLSRSFRPPFTNSGPEDIDDCGSYNEAIRVGQEAARDYLLVTDAEKVAIDLDVSTTLFKRTGIWTVKGFATSEDSGKFRWVVILAYHPSGTAGDRWELVNVTSRRMRE